MRLIFTVVLLWCAGALAGDRVAAARKAKAAQVRADFKAAKVAYPPGEVLLRAFKTERVLEVWAGTKDKPLTLIKTIPFCYASGEIGPKRRMGDSQVPEGFYRIDHFNPVSNFLLSLRVNYPNDSDKVLGAKGKLGGDIYIHGSCVSIGCIAIEDGPIQELYVLAADAKAAGAHLPVQIFPRRLDEAGMSALSVDPRATPELLAFWKNLQVGYLLFEQSRRPPRVSVNLQTGAYQLRPAR